MKATPRNTTLDAHQTFCAKCNSFEPTQSRIKNQQSNQTLTEYGESSPIRCYLPENSGSTNDVYQKANNSTNQPLKCHLLEGKDVFTNDVSVNTDTNVISRYRDAGSQAELDEFPDPPYFSGKSIPLKPLMKNVATETTLDTTEHPQDILPEEDRLNKTQRNLASENPHSVSLASHHCSDPFLFEANKLSSRTTDGIDAEYLYGSESVLHPANSSTGCLDCIVESSNYPAQWSCESRVSQTHFIAHENYVELTPCTDRNGFDFTRSLYESAHSSVPRVTWYNSINQIHQSYKTNSKEDIQSTASDGRRVISELCISPVPHYVERSAQLIKVTKECGDEGLPSVARNETSCTMNIRREVTSTGYPVACSITTSLGQRDSSKKRNPVQRQTYTNRGQPTIPIQGHCTTDRMKLDESNLLTDSLGDRFMCKSQLCRQDNTTRRRSLSRNSLKRDSRPSTAHPSIGTRSTESRRKRTENKQMIHHNCTVITKEMVSHRSDKSDHTSRKYALFAHSTSDDGDASKITQRDRSIDRSSMSSLHSRATHINRRSTQQQSKRSASKSPSLIKKTQKHGGALPESKDLHQCPTGRHLDVKPDKPCICIMVKRMVLEQSKPVLYSWHIETRKPSDRRRGSVTSFSKHSEDTDCRTGTPMTYAARLNIPTLPNFQLARPTRMVRGGQGTVAWVTNVTTGHFYALKFKQREGRSDSTWAIERREAKLLRNARHEFIVRLFHIYETAETLFMALEWLDGGCLWNHIARSGTMPECYAVYYAACILMALQYLHKQCIVYRDMKAENVVLDQRGRPKLIDFGMAKRFNRPPPIEDSHDSLREDSINDSEDFDQPPTRYYFAAYLAPEIYDHSQLTNKLIDSWGLGYIVVEMLLGYGIFLPMPWEKEPGHHLNENWKLTLPNEAASRLSPVCDDFIHKMLLRTPEDRMDLTQAGEHKFFSRVPWEKLCTIRGPDLSKCPTKSTTTTRTATAMSNGSRRWLPKSDSFVHVPDLAFVREFYGSVANPGVLYATQAIGLTTRRARNVRIQQLKGSSVATDGRSSATESDVTRSNTGITRKRSLLGSAIEIRSAQATGNDRKGDNGKVNRATRRTGVSAV